MENGIWRPQSGWEEFIATELFLFLEQKSSQFPGLRSIYVCIYWAVLRRFRHVQHFVTLGTLAHQAPLSMGFSRQEYWSRLSCPPPEDLPDPGIEPVSHKSLALGDRFFTTSTTWEAHKLHIIVLYFSSFPLFNSTLYISSYQRICAEIFIYFKANVIVKSCNEYPYMLPPQTHIQKKNNSG